MRDERRSPNHGVGPTLRMGMLPGDASWSWFIFLLTFRSRCVTFIFFLSFEVFCSVLEFGPVAVPTGRDITALCLSPHAFF